MDFVISEEVVSYHELIPEIVLPIFKPIFPSFLSEVFLETFL